MHRRQDGTEHLLLVSRAGRCFDAEEVGRHLGQRLPASLDQALQHSATPEEEGLLVAWREIDQPGYDGPGEVVAPLRSALFARPGKILCVGQNFRRHAEEMGAPLPHWPVLFSKFNNTLAAPECTIVLPEADVAFKFDYETELVVVIGQRLASSDPGDVMHAVAGYCTGHDFTARDLQKERGGQWLLGKTLDGFAPIGPDFVGAALAGDPADMRIETRVNDSVVQSSSTADFIFPVPQVLRYTARHFPLLPGDLLFTGTPEGVIAGKPADQQRWLRAGDRLASTVGDLGTLRFSLA
jgi:2-keto-4-pentenoate hydratase/2-oxohepta-3-ene-1,7-dioic acid hydratase in catechol pathway